MTEPHESGRARVVLLESDALAREIVVRRLRRRLDFEIVIVESASAAIDVVERDARVRAAVLDFDVVGIAAFRRLSSLDRAPRLIACGSSFDEDVVASLSELGVGAGRVFTKPFRFGELLRAVRSELADGDLRLPGPAGALPDDGFVAKSP